MKYNKQPLVSVIMPVYNAEAYLAHAINSILSQTIQDIEFVIVDDASTDNSYKIAHDYALRDHRIKLYRNKKNSGVSKTAKIAIDHSTGQFIARMDADDIALPERFAKQVKYLKANPKTVAVGAQCLLIDKDGTIIGQKNFPTKFEDIYKYIFQFVPVQQPTLMINRKLLPEDFQFYRDGMNTAEEIELIFKLFMYGKVENLPDVLLMYRVHNGNTSFKNIKKTFFLTIISRIMAIFDYKYRPTVFGIIVTLLQVIMVLTLSSKMIFWLYSMTRKTALYHRISFLPVNRFSLSLARESA
ncbi:MAG TPA: glycosyltransferase family 2 protein [Candidatus Saccharimonadales bacterium]|nr:glycosyltransferase family 2 protein [Candidatus Saccharimonadales bacterium]